MNQQKDFQSKVCEGPMEASPTEAASPADIQHRNRPHQTSQSYCLPKLILILLLLSGTGNTSLAQSCPPQISYIKIVGVDQEDPEKIIPGTSVQTDMIEMETGVIGADGIKSGVQRFRRNGGIVYIPFLLSIQGVQYTRSSGALGWAMPEDPRWYPCWQVQKAPHPDRTMLPPPLVDHPSSWLGGYPLRDFYEPFDVASANCKLVEGGVSTLRSDPLTGELVARANATSQGNTPVFVEFVYFDEAWLPGRITSMRIPNEFLNGTDVEMKANPLGPPPNWATHYGARLTDENGEPLLNCSPYGLALLPLKPAYFLPSPGCDYEQTVMEGTPIISLISAADGRQPIRYRWFKDGSLIAGANASVLEILNVEEADEGTYWVEAWNPDGPPTECEIRLKVIVPPQVTSLTAWSPPHPLDPAPACGDHSSFEGHSVTFKVEATGTPPLRYQWRKDNGNIFDDYRISGAKTDELTIKWLIFGDSGEYHVVVSNEAGEVSSHRIRLCSLHLAFGPGFIENPAIKSPLGRPIKVGDDLTLGAKVWGSFPLAAQWLKNGQPFRSATVLTGNATNNVTLTISNAQTIDSGYYFLSLSNINGFVVSSNVVVVDVLAEPKITSLVPITQTGWGGASVRFEVTATGSQLGYQWRKAGNALSNSTKITGVNTPTLTVANLHATDAGSYDVVVNNAVGSDTSASATLTVLTTVAISQHPVSKSVTAGQGVFFSVSASGTPPLAYRWHKNGSPLNNGGRFSGTATDTLQIANVQAGDAGEYHVVITGVAGNQRPSNPATLSVVLPPTITQQPELLIVTVGQMAHFEVKATGTPPLSYRWRRNGVLLLNGGGLDGVNSPELTIANAQLRDAGDYDVVVSNGTGSSTSDKARLVVEDPLITRAPTIEAHPQNLSVSEGQAAGFSARASGNPSPSLRWQRSTDNGSSWEVLEEGGVFAGTTGNTLMISRATVAMNGDRFRLRATNSIDTADSDAAILTVSHPAGLLAYFPFDGNAQDASGFERHGTVVGGGVSPTVDRYGRPDSAYAFDGTTQISVADLDPDDHAEGFSFGFWMKPDSGQGWPVYWAEDAGWGSTYINFTAPTTIEFRLGSRSSSTHYQVSGLNLVLGEWHHLFVTHDLDWNRLYVNGALVFEAASLPLRGNISTLAIGAVFAGDLDDLAVYGRGFSAAEVAAIFNDGISLDPSQPPRVLSESLRRLPNGTFQFTVQSEPNVLPVIEVTEDFITWPVISLPHTPPDETGLVTFTESEADARALRFYRARVP